MPGTILSSCPRQREPLPPLGPGERLINGRVYYSAAWLCSPLEAEVVKAGLKPVRSLDRRRPTVTPGVGG
jgi:hypothetical protein